MSFSVGINMPASFGVSHQPNCSHLIILKACMCLWSLLVTMCVVGGCLEAVMVLIWCLVALVTN